MKEYKRLDPNRPLTENELFQITNFFKKSELRKLIAQLVAKDSTLTEKALYVGKVISFYQKRIVTELSDLSPAFKKAREEFEAEQEKNSPYQRLLRTLFRNEV